jgi:DNA-directed RNA polymerase subunit RPC12/RpoP
MVAYKCFHCGAKIKSDELKVRFVCPKCNSRVFYKPRNLMKTVKAV